MRNHCNHSQSNFQQDLSNTLRRLWMEHVLWTRAFIVSTALNSPDLDAVTKRLLRNPTDFTSILKQLYNPTQVSQFEKLFTDHLLIASHLVNAAKSGDAQSVDAYRKDWYTNASDVAKLLREMNPYWNSTEWLKMLFHHLAMTENEAVQILTGKFPESIVQYDAIQAEALTMADAMSKGIFQQVSR